MSAPDIGIDIKFTGGAELMACLREEVPRVAKNALRTGLFKGAKIVETAARANAPRNKGKRSAMSIKYGPLFKKIKARRGRGTVNTVMAGLSFGTAFYGLFSERGTKKRFTKKGAYRGFMMARPFMISALEQNQAAVIAKVIEATREALLKIKTKTRQAKI